MARFTENRWTSAIIPALADLDIKADEVDSIVDAAPALTEWTCVPEPMTKDNLLQR